MKLSRNQLAQTQYLRPVHQDLDVEMAPLSMAQRPMSKPNPGLGKDNTGLPFLTNTTTTHPQLSDFWGDRRKEETFQKY